MSKKKVTKFSVIFTLPHQVGALDNMLQTIKQSQINIDRIESRPIETQYWQYYFYIDFGYFGIALGSFVFGFYVWSLINLGNEMENVRSLVAYLILIQFIVFSVARIYTGLSTRALSLVWLFLLFRKVRIGMSEKGGRVWSIRFIYKCKLYLICLFAVTELSLLWER